LVAWWFSPNNNNDPKNLGKQAARTGGHVSVGNYISTTLPDIIPTKGQTLHLMNRIIKSDGDKDVLSHFLTSVTDKPDDANGYANTGNTLVRLTEAHMLENPALFPGERYEAFYHYKIAFNLALAHFRKAIQISEQFGAHYSLGLLLKLHSELLFNDENNTKTNDAVSVGYEHLCDSQRSYTNWMKR